MTGQVGESVTGADRIDALNLAHLRLKGFTAYSQGSDDIFRRRTYFKKPGQLTVRHAAAFRQPPLEAVLTGRNGPGRARTVANRAGTALTGAVRTGRNSCAAVNKARPRPDPATDKKAHGAGRRRPNKAMLSLSTLGSLSGHVMPGGAAAMTG